MFQLFFEHANLLVQIDTHDLARLVKIAQMLLIIHVLFKQLPLNLWLKRAGLETIILDHAKGNDVIINDIEWRVIMLQISDDIVFFVHILNFYNKKYKLL